MRKLIGKIESLGCKVNIDYDENYNDQQYVITIDWDLERQDPGNSSFGFGYSFEDALLQAVILLPKRIKEKL